MRFPPHSNRKVLYDSQLNDKITFDGQNKRGINPEKDSSSWQTVLVRGSRRVHSWLKGLPGKSGGRRHKGRRKREAAFCDVYRSSFTQDELSTYLHTPVHIQTPSANLLPLPGVSSLSTSSFNALLPIFHSLSPEVWHPLCFQRGLPQRRSACCGKSDQRRHYPLRTSHWWRGPMKIMLQWSNVVLCTVLKGTRHSGM